MDQESIIDVVRKAAAENRLSCEKARELAADFEDDMKNCDVFSLEEYEASPLWRRLLNSTTRLASPIL